MCELKWSMVLLSSFDWVSISLLISALSQPQQTETLSISQSRFFSLSLSQDSPGKKWRSRISLISPLRRRFSAVHLRTILLTFSPPLPLSASTPPSLSPQLLPFAPAAVSESPSHSPHPTGFPPEAMVEAAEVAATDTEKAVRRRRRTGRRTGRRRLWCWRRPGGRRRACRRIWQRRLRQGECRRWSCRGFWSWKNRRCCGGCCSSADLKNGFWRTICSWLRSPWNVALEFSQRSLSLFLFQITFTFLILVNYQIF